jgi:putative transcriptional regulator
VTVQHHPADFLLEGFAAGILDRGQHIAIATHLARCPRCRGWVGSVQHIGGVILSALPPAAMSTGAWNRVEARLVEPVRQSTPLPPGGLADVPGLPPFVRGLPAGNWRWVAPSLRQRRIVLPESEPTRVFLLKASPGTRLLPHAHTGIELTCVLSGSFSHDGASYGPGDFDHGDGSVDHEISVGPTGDCICLVAMQGELRLKGFVGRLVQPLVSL